MEMALKSIASVLSDPQRQLFDSPALIQARARFDPAAAFEAWLIAQRPALRPRTVLAYRLLWGKFLRFALEDKGRSFDAINADLIREFLSGLHGARRERRVRYQRVIERAMEDLLAQMPQLGLDNPARPRYLSEEGRARWLEEVPFNESMQFLSGHQALLLQLYLCQTPALSDSVALSWSCASAWRAARDAISVTLLLVCGLRVQELTAISVRCILPPDDDSPDWRLNVGAVSAAARARAASMRDLSQTYHGEAVGGRRRLALPAWARRLLEVWLARSLAACRSLGWSEAQWRDTPLLPGVRPNRDRRYQPKRARANLLMSEATLARALERLGRELGIKITAQMLRNTYGAQCLLAGDEDEAICRAMGYAPRGPSLWRLRRDWALWCRRNEPALLSEDPRGAEAGQAMYPTPGTRAAVPGSVPGAPDRVRSAD